MKDQKNNTSRLKSALFGVVALGAIGLVSASPAYATPLTGSFGFTVWQGNNPSPGSRYDHSQLANKNNTIWNGQVGNKLATFTYRGALDFCEGGNNCANSSNNIFDFLTSAGGSLSDFAGGSSSSDLNKRLSSSPFNLTTVMQIHSTLVPPIKGTKGTITSDDGSAIYTDGMNKRVAISPDPHTAKSYSFNLSNLTGGAFNILYVEANGLPAQLKFATNKSNVASVPEPGSLAVLGIGLLGIGFFIRRRRATRYPPSLSL